MNRDSEVAADALYCRKVYVWHMHTYSCTNDLSALRSFNEAVASRFGGESRVRVNKVAEKPFGPHPCIQFETGLLHTFGCAHA